MMQARNLQSNQNHLSDNAHMWLTTFKMLLIYGDMKDKYVDVQLVYVDMQLKCTMLLYIHNIDMWD